MKKIKLKKKVKVITTLLSFGMLLTVLPSMKLAAEDDTVATDTSNVSVGPYIKYQPAEDAYYSDEVSNDIDFTTLEANGTMAVATDDATNPVVNSDDNDSWTYDNKITVNKTIDKVSELEDVYKLTMSAKSKPNMVNPGVDFVLMLDMSNYMTTSSVSELKTAVNTFIDKIDDIADNSRIAIIKYNNIADVLSGSQVANDAALVTVRNNVDNLKSLVTNIGNTGSGNSNCDQAMLKAVQIFQSANNNNTADGNPNGGTYATRTRVSILFTAGLPGEGKDDYDASGWKYDARERAQAAMSLATILKGNKKEIITPSDASGVAGGKTWGAIKNNYINKDGATYAGCGSTVYAVGLGLPHSVIDTDGYLSIQEKQSALVNEYLYRVSSHRLGGLHYNLNEAKDYDTLFYNTFNGLDLNIQNAYSNDGMYFFYPDSLTRNRTDDYVTGSYYLTTDTASDLTNFFRDIASQAGENFKNLTVKDYIDSSFIPVDSNGNPYSDEKLANGVDIISSNGNGKLYFSSTEGYYVVWSQVELSYEASENGGKSFEESIYVKPVNGFIGGNNLITNRSQSGVYKEDGTSYAFPQPSVDIPINYEIEKSDQNIYLTNSVNLADLISNKPDGITNKGVKVTYTFTFEDDVKTLTYDPGSSNGVWKDVFDGNITFENGLTGDRKYTISYKVESANKDADTLKVSTSHHYHADVTDLNSDTNANVNVFIPHVQTKDLHGYYGDVIPKYIDSLKDADGQVNIVWKHGDSSDTSVIGQKYEKPALSDDTFSFTDGFEYTKDSTLEGKIPLKSDYRVNISVIYNDKNITDLTEFDHTNCNDDEVLSDKNSFIVHVNTCSLTIEKTGGSDDETYVFNVMKDGTKYTEVSIQGNSSIILSELPVGNYSIQEDTDLSWRYKSDGSEEHKGPVYSSDVTLSSTNTSGAIICTNTKSNDKWLNKITSAVQNVFGGEKHQSNKNSSTTN